MELARFTDEYIRALQSNSNLMNIKLAVSISILAGILQACNFADSGEQVSGDNTSAGRPTSSEQVDVFNDNIAVARHAPEAASTANTNLFNNPGFENGIEGWTACSSGAIETSSDANSGSGALHLRGGNCFYRSVLANPGDSYALNCHVKLTSDQAWTGMGMTFSNDEFVSLSQAPVTVVTSDEYMRMDTVASAPAGTSFISMWIHSDHGALVDDCSLSLESNQPAAEPVNATNLLANGDFSILGDNDGVRYWTRGCGGSVVADGSSLYVADGACADQALSTGALNNIATNSATLSCLVTETSGYSALSIFLDNESQAKKVITADDKNTRVSLSTDALRAGNGFVSLYSEGHLTVENCRLTSSDESTNAGSDIDSTSSTPTSNNTDSAPDSNTDTGVTSARYRLTFNATWSAVNHPTNFPPPAHFSPLVGAVHNDQVVFWATGQTATPGIKLMAETGDGSILLDEVNSAIANGSAATDIFGNGIPVSPGVASVEFEVTRDHPLVTVTSMVAPSPDWFVGIRDIALFDGTNFIDTLTLELPVYDSGTDSGERFTSADQVTQPADAISRLSTNSADTDFMNGLPGMGQFVIEKLP